VVILSGSEAETDVNTCYTNGANAYLVKPGSPQKFELLTTTLGNFWFNLGRVPC